MRGLPEGGLRDTAANPPYSRSEQAASGETPRVVPPKAVGMWRIALQAAAVLAIEPLAFYLRLSLILTRVVSMTVPGVFRISSTPLSLFARLVLTILLPNRVSLSCTFAV